MNLKLYRPTAALAGNDRPLSVCDLLNDRLMNDTDYVD